MSDQCLSSFPSPSRFWCRLLSDFQLFLSFMNSHPLCFSFFIFFFSPYLIQWLSFLSPLFITTSLLSLLTLSPGFIHGNSPLQASESKMALLLSTYNTIMETLNAEISNRNEELHEFEELEAYKMLFDSSSSYGRVSDVRSEEMCCQEHEEEPVLKPSTGSDTLESAFGSSEEKTVEVAWEEIMINEFDDFGNTEFNLEGKKGDPQSSESDEDEEESLPVRMGSNAKGGFKDTSVEMSTDNGTSEAATNSVVLLEEHICGVEKKMAERPVISTFDTNLGAYGSMRKDKEWKRTLACKLFEDRHNANVGVEGMDSLWEVHENSKVKSTNTNECDDYDDGMDAKLCCLQALSFSTRKMNMGMGRPNLVKFSKAIKGMGWFHRVTKHGRKGKVEK